MSDPVSIPADSVKVLTTGEAVAKTGAKAKPKTDKVTTRKESVVPKKAPAKKAPAKKAPAKKAAKPPFARSKPVADAKPATKKAPAKKAPAKKVARKQEGSTRTNPTLKGMSQPGTLGDCIKKELLAKTPRDKIIAKAEKKFPDAVSIDAYIRICRKQLRDNGKKV